MRDLTRLLESKGFGSLDEANEFLRTLTGGDLQKALSDAPPSTPREQARELAWKAMEAASLDSGAREARKLAKRALALDADCVEAIVVLTSLDANSPQEAIAGFERAVAAGERSLGPDYFRENKGHFWALLETRPYMRARLELAEVILGSGRIEDAIKHFEAMLDLNPMDNQGVRDTLLGLYLQTGNLEGAGSLLQRYQQDASCAFAWSRTLERFLAGDREAAARLLGEARKQNHFVEQYMTLQRSIPDELPDSYALGSNEEALASFEGLASAWTAHSDAMMWLFEQILDRSAPGIPGTHRDPKVQ